MKTLELGTLRTLQQRDPADLGNAEAETAGTGETGTDDLGTGTGD